MCVDSKPNMLRAQAERCEIWTNPDVAARGAAHISTRLAIAMQSRNYASMDRCISHAYMNAPIPQ
jgi:hypothetical protein